MYFIIIEEKFQVFLGHVTNKFIIILTEPGQKTNFAIKDIKIILL